MATNSALNGRVGAVKNRFQIKKNNRWHKYNSLTKRLVSVKKDEEPYKGVRKLKKSTNKSSLKTNSNALKGSKSSKKTKNKKGGKKYGKKR